MVLVLAACSRAPGTPLPPPDLPYTAPTDSLVPAFDGRLNAPHGLSVTQFAAVPNARAIVVGPDGSVYVSQPFRGEIARVRDGDGDGVGEWQAVVLRGLDRPHGMAFRGSWFYVANTSAVVRFALDRAGVPGGEPETIARYTGGGGHWTRSIAFGADGALYVSIGSSCNVCEERREDRATVMRFDPDGGGGRIFARGLRNAVGMAVHPVTGAVWVTQNERDNLRPDHQDLPPEEINILRDGADYGWPYCHSDRVPNPEYRNAARCATTEAPALIMQAHSAPLGIAFLDRAVQLPAAYRGDVLVAFHGSWNRDVPTGYKVVRVRVEAGQPVSYEDFVTGWLVRRTSWGRPVDIAVAADGAVLITDDQGGVVWRIGES